jgi:hypothetical protein
VFFQKLKIGPKKTVAKKSESEQERDNNQNPKILEVNLVKDEVLVFFDWNKHIVITVLALLIAGLLIFEIYAGLNYWVEQENLKALSLEAETTKLKAEVVNLNNSAAAALAYKDKSAAFSELLANHVYWTNFFSWLEKNTLSSVRYGSFSGDLSGNYSLSATAQSFADASWQVKAFLNSPLVEKVEVSSVASSKKVDESNISAAGQSAGLVSFGLTFKIKPEVFKSEVSLK